MTPSEIQQVLVDLGWPLAVDGVYGPMTKQAVEDFQAGYSFSDLVVDGIVGPYTENALTTSRQRGGQCGTYFKFVEFKSKGDGWIKVNRDLVRGLDDYRSHVGPTSVVSGYRDSAYNSQVGGASNSQHLYGNAADLSPVANFEEVESWRVFSGIGLTDPDKRLVRHVDVRHSDVEGAHNTTGGTVDKPTIWYYSGA